MDFRQNLLRSPLQFLQLINNSCHHNATTSSKQVCKTVLEVGLHNLRLERGFLPGRRQGSKQLHQGGRSLKVTWATCSETLTSRQLISRVFRSTRVFVQERHPCL